MSSKQEKLALLVHSMCLFPLQITKRRTGLDVGRQSKLLDSEHEINLNSKFGTPSIILINMTILIIVIILFGICVYEGTSSD